MSDPIIVITQPADPTLEIQSIEGARNYSAKVAGLNHQELCIELSNVMAAKHNNMAPSADLPNYMKKQAVVTDLTDKATIICFIHFGQTYVKECCGGDLKQFNALLNDVDEEVAQQDMQQEEFGHNILEILAKRLRQSMKQ